MALVLADRVKDTTTTTGTGTVTLSGTAPTGYQNFAVIGNGNTTYYTIAGGSEWEVGIGTYATSGPTLARTTVLASTNGGSAVSFSSGTKDVFVTYPAERSANLDASSVLSVGTSAVLGTATGGSQGTGTINAQGYYLNGVNIGNVYTKTVFTATAAQTTFTVAYTVGYVDVYYNGSKLSTSEYTASTGTTVVLGTAATSGDIVEIIAWTVYSVTNTNIGIGTGTSLALGGATLGSNALAVTGTTQLNSALNYGGVTLSNAVTGTGSMVLSAAPTFTGTPTFVSGALVYDSSGTLNNFIGFLEAGASGNKAGIYFGSSASRGAIYGASGGSGTRYVTTSGSPMLFGSVSGADARDATTFSEKMRLDSSGNLGIGMTPVNVLDITQNQNTTSQISLLNNSAGAAALALLNVTNGLTNVNLGLCGTGYTTNGTLVANRAFMFAAAAAGIAITASGGPVVFGSGSNTEVARFDTSGQLGIGMTPSQVLDITKSHNNFSAVQITNSNVGASAYSGYQINNGSITGGIILSGSGNAEANTVVVYANSGGSVSIQPSGGSGITQFKTNGSESARIDASGNLLVGTTSSNGRISLQTPSGTGTSIGALQVGTGEWGIGSTASSNYFWLTNRTGTAALGLASQSIGISSAGAVRMGAYGAGTATFDASGNITSVSDPSQKNFVASYKRGLPEILAIAKDDKFLGLHTWRKESGMETEGVYASFFAHDDFPITDAVHKGANGINSFSDRPVIMALVNAVAELTTRLAALESK